MFFDRDETRLSRLPLKAASLESEEDSSIQSVVAVLEPTPPEEEEEEEVRPPLLEWIGRRARRWVMGD